MTRAAVAGRPDQGREALTPTLYPPGARERGGGAFFAATCESRALSLSPAGRGQGEGGRVSGQAAGRRRSRVLRRA
jgi:hypothetical protein